MCFLQKSHSQFNELCGNIFMHFWYIVLERAQCAF